jgi:hypothetical protein
METIMTIIGIEFPCYSDAFKKERHARLIWSCADPIINKLLMLSGLLIGFKPHSL